MSIKVTCSSCGKTLKAKDALAGKRVKCPDCGEPIRIPVPKAQRKPEAEDFGDTIDFGGFDPNAGVAVEMRKPCPACGEMIQPDAVKCRYCGEVFDKTLKKRAPVKQERPTYSSDSDDDNLGVVGWLLAILCPGIGCIVGIVWMIQGKPKGMKLIATSIVVAVVSGIVRFAIQNAMQR